MHHQPARRVDHLVNPAFPGSVKLNAGDVRENVNCNGLTAHVEKRTAFREVGEGQSFQRCAELRQRRIYRFAVFGVWFN